MVDRLATRAQEAKSLLTVTIHQPETLPWLGFMDKLRQCDVLVLLDHVQFSKHYFQNRNRIRTLAPQGWSWLTVPVTKGSSFQRICDVHIDTNQYGWRREHIGLLRQSYRDAPFFERYISTIKSLYECGWDRLVDFNIAIIGWLTNAFGIERLMLRSSELDVSGARSELNLAICKSVGATEYLSGISGREYLDVGLFESAGIAVRFQEFYHPIYRQRYEPFVPSLSSIDLLFNHGDASLAILESEEVPRLSTVLL